MTTEFSWDYIEHITQRCLANAGRSCVSTIAEALEAGSYERCGTWQIDGDGDDRTVTRDGVVVHGPGAVDDDKLYAQIAIEIGSFAPTETPTRATVHLLEVFTLEQTVSAQAA